MRTKVISLAGAVTGAVLITAAFGVASAQPSAVGDEPVVGEFQQTSRSTDWQLQRRIPLRFDTYHPQGLAVVGDRLFLSSVEITEAPTKYPQPVDGYDSSPGKGVAHVFVLDRDDGTLIKDIVLGEGTMYHPGGIDFDGTSLWVPVAEYRPDSRSIIYRIDPDTYEAHEAFRVDDHIGGTVRDRATGRVHGVSWGSRTLYQWTERGTQLSAEPNRSHFIDYQDCDYAAAQSMICGGVAAIPTPEGSTLELGGLALVDLRDNRIRHEIPLQRYSAAGHVITRNPVYLEPHNGGLRLWSAPDDGDETNGTELLIYTAPTGQ